MRRTLQIVTTLLAAIGIAASIEYLLATEHHNPGFAEWPVTMRVHVIFGAVFLALALAQFTRRIRTRLPWMHRLGGRIAVASGIAAGITALVIAFFFQYSGAAGIPLIVPFGVFFLLALTRGLWLARQRRFAEHREWMIRAMAIATSIATMRLIFVPLLIGMGGTEEIARWLSLVSFFAAFVIHTVAAEWWIRATRPKRVPASAAVPVALDIPQPTR